MPKKALASLNVVINAVTAPLFRGLARASKRLIAFGAKMRAVGRSISMSFTLPFLAIGAAGAKMAIDFEKNMTKIKTLVGLSGKQVNEFSKQVMQLSGKTAQAPADLADGLYFLTSAGLRGADAMKTLEAVGKGVAIGLGEQTDLAKVAAAAQNAYGKDVVSSTQAIDEFGMAVRTGMFEASELAEALGTQVGMASELKISFKELLANISTYTKTTGDARSATVGFGGIMMAITKPTEKGRKALDKINMSYGTLRKMVAEAGLAKTLFHLKDAFKANGVEMTDLFGKSQAVKNIMGVLGTQGKTYIQILGEMDNATGLVNDGFSDLEQTTGFKMLKSWNNLKLATQELGVIMMPIFTKIVDGITRLAKGFQQLDGGTKKMILAAGTLVAFSGPLMALAGGLVTVLGMILTPVGLVVVALGALFAVIYDNWDAIKPIFVDFINYWITLYNESAAFKFMVEMIKLEFGLLWATVKLFFKGLFQLIENMITYAIPQFTALGKVIRGAFSMNPKLLAEGFGDMIENGARVMSEGMAEIGEEWALAAEELGKTFHENIMSKEPIELVSEAQIDKGIADVVTYLTDKMKAVRDKIASLFGGGTFIPTAEGGGEEGGDDRGWKSFYPNPTEDMRSHWQKFMDWGEGAFGDWGKKIGDIWGKISQVAQRAITAIGNLWAAEHEKQKTILENEKVLADEALAKEMQDERTKIQNSLMTAEQKKEALLGIKKSFDNDQEGLDKAHDVKVKALQKKQAIRDKKMKIASALMGTANAIVQALGLKFPLNLIMASLVGAMGMAQVAAISSTPLPLAKGGLAFGPTNAIVGDNPGAANDPEVIAPLSKLKQMLHNEMNVQLNVAGMIKGNDIYLSNESTTDQRPRYI